MILALLLAASPPSAAPSAADTAFSQLKTLVGDWRNAANPKSPLRVRFSLTAGGTVLVEEWKRGEAPHSLTLYHRDGAALVATHYCPQGNQPRLALVADGKPGIRFAFRDATDLDPATESHQHALAFDLTDPARLVRSEVYRSAKGDEPDTLTLVRAVP